VLTKEEHATLLRSFEVDRLLKLVTLEAKRRHDGHFGVPGVFGRKFTVCPSAFDFTELTSVGDQKGCRKSAQFRLENRGFFLVCEVIIYESLCDQCNR
jgi:hypothetical protein